MSQLSIARFPKFIFANNPAEIVFRKKGILTTAATYPYLLLTLYTDADIPGDGEILKLTLGTSGEEIIFTFSNTPAEQQGYLPVYVSGTGANYMKEVARHIYRHPRIKRDYQVAYVGEDSNAHVIRILSRSRGSKFNIEVHAVDTTVEYDSKDVSSPDDAVLEDYKLNIRATLVRDSLYHWTEKNIDNIEATGIPDADRDEVLITVHELPALAKAELGVDIPDNAFLPMPWRKASCLMKLEVEESYTGFDGKAQIQEYLDLDNTDGDAPIEIFVPVLGGLSLDRFPVDNFDKWAMGTVIKAFNLQIDATKIISEDSPEWISAYGINSLSAYINIRTRYKDGFTNTITSSVLHTDGLPFSFPTGIKQTGIPTTHAGTPLLSYEIWLAVEYSGGTIEGKVMTYIIDQRYFKEQRYFIYQNSLGAIDTLRCVGVNEYSVKRSGATSTQVLTSDSRMNRGSIEMVYSELEHQWTMRTGWLLNKAEKELMLDFLRSNYVAEIIMPLLEPDTETVGEGEDAETLTTYYKQPYRSVIVLQDSVDMWGDEGAWGFEWKMQYAHKETNYSNIPALKEQWYDTFVEFTVLVKEIVDTEPVLGFLTDDNANLLLEVNGAIQDNIAYTFPATGVYHVKLSGSGLKNLYFAVGDVEADVTITRIETNSIQLFSFAYFDNVLGDYWMKRLETFFTLEEISVFTGTDPGFDVDAFLGALAVLYNRMQGDSNLAVIECTNSTPSITGTLIADYLDNEGISVTTG